MKRKQSSLTSSSTTWRRCKATIDRRVEGPRCVMCIFDRRRCPHRFVDGKSIYFELQIAAKIKNRHNQYHSHRHYTHTPIQKLHNGTQWLSTRKYTEIAIIIHSDRLRSMIETLHVLLLQADRLGAVVWCFSFFILLLFLVISFFFLSFIVCAPKCTIRTMEWELVVYFYFSFNCRCLHDR